MKFYKLKLNLLCMTNIDVYKNLIKKISVSIKLASRKIIIDTTDALPGIFS